MQEVEGEQLTITHLQHLAALVAEVLVGLQQHLVLLEEQILVVVVELEVDSAEPVMVLTEVLV